MAEHFVKPPYWEWYILFYFFLGGLTGGLYALGTMLRLWGGEQDEPAAQTAFLAAFPALVICPILLTLDLGRPGRFWHMLIDTTPGAGGLAFKYWSPMSIGSWALLVYGAFSFVSFLEALAPRRRGRAGGGAGGRLFNVVGAIFGLYVASYTGVLLSVSNQPVWSDSWALGGLFLASGLSGAAALLTCLVRSGRGADAGGSEAKLARAERWFALLELLLVALVFVNLAGAGALARTLAGPWAVVWALVILSLVPPLAGSRGPSVQVASASGSEAVARAVGGLSPAAVAAIVLVGTLLLRFVVIFSAQF
jgi:formate-dependent nitrite reductase membrane component NrfD